MSSTASQAVATGSHGVHVRRQRAPAGHGTPPGPRGRGPPKHVLLGSGEALVQVVGGPSGPVGPWRRRAWCGGRQGLGGARQGPPYQVIEQVGHHCPVNASRVARAAWLPGSSRAAADRNLVAAMAAGQAFGHTASAALTYPRNTTASPQPSSPARRSVIALMLPWYGPSAGAQIVCV